MSTDGPGGQLRRHDDFPSRFLDNTRSLAVYLPPGYDADLGRRYPVLYLHDGQNLFDPAEAAFGVAWDAAATAERLIRTGRLEPIVLVGVYNTADRVDEYTPHYDRREKAGGKGGPYGRFVLDEVKPFIDAEYRTLPGREHTGVVGSSLGGLVSLAMAREHRDRFTMCGALSPSLWWGREGLLNELERDHGWMRGTRFWVDMGTREGGRSRGLPRGIVQARRLLGLFDAAGLVPGRHYYYWEVVGGEHNEAAWAARFDKVLLYFFGE